MSTQASTPDASRSHRRIVSSEERRRAALPRRLTKGPLEAASSSLSTSEIASNHTQTPTPVSPSKPPQEMDEAPATSHEHPARDFGYLLRPENYHPLTQLEIPPAFRRSPHQPSHDTPLPELLSAGHFRTAAVASAVLLTTTVPPTDHVQIFSLLYIRLATLTLINATLLAAQEVKILEDLNSAFYHDPLTNDNLVPWPLRVLAVRLQGIGFGDWRRGVMGYYELAREARLELRKATATGEERETWTTRLKDLGIRVANALVEMGDLEGAARHLKTLRRPDATTGMQEDDIMSTRLALLYLRIGDITAAKEYAECSSSQTDGMQTSPTSILRPLLSMADGDYNAAVDGWRHLLEDDSSSPLSDGPHIAMMTQNLAVCLLYTGHLDEARNILESLTQPQQEQVQSASEDGYSYPFQALTFNLCTIYELCTDKSRALKLELAERIAARAPRRGGGEGAGGLKWEMGNGDFKL